MKIDLDYAIKLLKQLENVFPQGQIKEKWDSETSEAHKKRFCHLIYLIDEGLITEIPPDLQRNRIYETYRINSKGINLLNSFDLKTQLANH